MKMLLFKPEIGTLTRFEYPTGGRIVDLLEERCFNTHKVVIDDVEYKFFVVPTAKVEPANLWSFYNLSNNQCFYGNIVIGLYGPIPSEEKDITAEDMLRIRSHIVVRNKGYMIYLDK